MTRKRFRTISSSSQPPVPPSQEATASQEATPSQPPTHPSEQATMPSFDYDQSLNDNEIIETIYNPRASIRGYCQELVPQRFRREMENYKCSLKQKFFDEAFTPQTASKSCRKTKIALPNDGPHCRIKELRTLCSRIERHGRIRGVGLGPTPSSHPANTNEQRQYQNVANNNHVSPAIHRSSHASRKTSADNADDAESVGADGADESAESGED
ncbi:hypothetical protein CJ030_MR3G025376 [Morella rubra]|uniref:Uncharacterized protein n=1 Tax=Morella rubra TaxID=262757 RepID=A0A6A1W7Q2_9ROSI|nr:hypothetical protein CJ030_MR3G025376 [Morella rubra]